MWLNHLWTKSNKVTIFFFRKYKNVLPQKQFIFPIYSVFDRKVCYEDAGCFTTGGDFFHPIFRPISLLPIDPKKMDLEYVLYTRSNRDGLVLDKKNFDLFNGTKSTVILIHGYLDIKIFAKWMITLKDNLLDRWDYNIINLYWHSGSYLFWSLFSELQKNYQT